MEKLNGRIFFETNDEIKKQMKDAYLSCPTAVNHVNKLNISDDLIDKNIDIIYDFVRDINYCSKCPGIDNCIKINPTLCTKVTYQNGVVERQLTPCKKVLEKIQLENQFITMDFDINWLNMTKDDFDRTKERAKVLRKYANYCKGLSNEWIYIHGSQNTGRTFVAAYLATDLAKKQKGPICFINSVLRFRKLSDIHYKNQDKFQELLDLYSTVPVLVIDDFGNEYKNDFVRDAILYEILSKRSAAKLFTIFTSDFTIDEVSTLYAVNKVAQIRAKQINRLLKNGCKEEISLGEVSIY